MNHGIDNDMKEFNVDAKAECEQLNLSHETETKNASAQYRFNRDPLRKIMTDVLLLLHVPGVPLVPILGFIVTVHISTSRRLQSTAQVHQSKLAASR